MQATKFLTRVALVSIIFLTSSKVLRSQNVFPSSGNVGIGVTDPRAKLEIKGGLIVGRNNEGVTNLNNGISINCVGTAFNNNYTSYLTSVAGDGIVPANSAFAIDVQHWNGTSYLLKRVAYFRNDGNVGIGTTNPGSFKLAVEGKIGAREVNVTATSPFPDYVFENTYKLRPLTEVASYIKENKHLPEIPSAKEVETNGINLGEMDALLLKKIEELTLYMIEMKKELSDSQKENAQLKERILKLEN